MQECIFCQIVKKQIPAKIVYEDEIAIAFLDINPLSVGHTLVIPKKHFENIFDIDERELQHILTIAKKISLRIKENLGATGINIFQASGKEAEQSIPHFHLHIIPRKEGDELNVNEWWRIKVKKIEDSQLKEIADLIKIESENKKQKERTKEEIYWIRRELELG